MSHLNNEQKNELITLSSANDEVSMYEKEAEMVLLQSLISFQKKQLMKQIDYTLVNNDEDLFLELSQQYITLLSQHSYIN